MPERRDFRRSTDRGFRIRKRVRHSVLFEDDIAMITNPAQILRRQDFRSLDSKIGSAAINVLIGCTWRARLCRSFAATAGFA